VPETEVGPESLGCSLDVADCYEDVIEPARR